jgi:toxin ParE1/3/4
MGDVVVTEQATADIRAIISGLNISSGYSVAARYSADFKRTFVALEQFPGSGAPRPKLGRKACIKIVSPYLIVYDHEGDTATIIRVLHGKRKITRNLVRG